MHVKEQCTAGVKGASVLVLPPQHPGELVVVQGGSTANTRPLLEAVAEPGLGVVAVTIDSFGT